MKRREFVKQLGIGVVAGAAMGCSSMSGNKEITPLQSSTLLNKLTASMSSLVSKLKNQRSLSVVDWDNLANVANQIVDEEVRLNNTQRFDIYVSQNLSQLKAGRPVEQQQAIDWLHQQGLYAVLQRPISIYRQAGMGINPRGFCFGPARLFEGAGLVLSLDPFTAPVGLIIGLSGIALDAMDHYELC